MKFFLFTDYRFVFHELMSTKIDNKVVFPLENLDLSCYLSGPEADNMLYDLQACICHFGGKAHHIALNNMSYRYI